MKRKMECTIQAWIIWLQLCLRSQKLAQLGIEMGWPGRSVLVRMPVRINKLKNCIS